VKQEFDVYIREGEVSEGKFATDIHFSCASLHFRLQQIRQVNQEHWRSKKIKTKRHPNSERQKALKQKGAQLVSNRFEACLANALAIPIFQETRLREGAQVD